LNFVPTYIAFIFNPNNGKYIGSTFINNKLHEEVYFQIRNPLQLSEKDISTLARYSEKAAFKAIKSFINKH